MQGVQAPNQARSRITYNNLLDAAENLLNRKSWMEITVNDVVTQANSSVGSFYARFEDKNALLRCLSERLSQYAEQEASRLFKGGHSLSLDRFVERVVIRLMQIHQVKRGLIRTLTLLPRVYTDERFPEDGLRTAGVFHSLAARLAAYDVDESRVSVGLFFTVTAIREKVVFADTSKPLLRMGKERFAHELASALLAYIKV